MNRNIIVNRIISSGAIAIIRLNSPSKIERIAEALNKGGISVIEITMTTPDALRTIETLSRSIGDEILLGVGSVLDSQTAIDAICAGAKYIVCPVLKTEIIATVHKYNMPVMPGCFTPTEIQQAHEYGADIIKSFPADILGMPFFRAIKAPLPHLNIMPTGGVTLTNAGEWLESGACAVGVGTALLDKKIIEDGNYNQLTENARILRSSIDSFRKN
jgi:2-dehydro-3-deoxyphosphogluconate aldolase / (4S)-4-hydroxy-2-oxoglutarate aldolase